MPFFLWWFLGRWSRLLRRCQANGKMSCQANGKMSHVSLAPK
uniref:Uncharacterized protein n=1 Tax=Setaria viridis TaxID=4556 RepID=A0A4U6T8Z7_SETVI|nr:hypothetical protein SEVIR_9G450750v2 [Setaria viridis]